MKNMHNFNTISLLASSVTILYMVSHYIVIVHKTAESTCPVKPYRNTTMSSFSVWCLVNFVPLQRKVCDVWRRLCLTLQRFVKLRLRGFIIIKLFRKAFPNFFSKQANFLMKPIQQPHMRHHVQYPQITRRLRKLFLQRVVHIYCWSCDYTLNILLPTNFLIPYMLDQSSSCIKAALKYHNFYCYYYKRVLILANFSEFVINSKLSTR